MSRSAGLGERREVTIAGGRMVYRDTGGTGPAVLLLHGVLVNGDLWRDVVPGLAAGGYRCLTPDLPLGSHELPMRPGTDLSPPGLAEMLAGFLDSLGIGDVTVVANDTGGAIAQILLAGHPQRIGRLVLTSCDALNHFPPPLVKVVFATLRVPGMIWLAAQSMRLRWLQRTPFAFGWLTRRPVPADMVESFMAPARRRRGVRRDLREVIRGLDARHTVRAAEMLRRTDRPVLLVWGGFDRVFPIADARRLQRMIPDATLVVLDGCRGFVPLDEPVRLVDEVLRFIARPSRQQAPPLRV